MFKKIISAIVGGQMERCVDYATSLGVPRSYSVAVIAGPLLDKYIDAINRQNPTIGKLAVYKQYGLAIKAMYEEETP